MNRICFALFTQQQILCDVPAVLPLSTGGIQRCWQQMLWPLLLILLCALSQQAQATQQKNTNFSPKVVLVSIDGLRWQELFYGADAELANDSRYVRNSTLLSPLLQGNKAENLLPFFHQVIKKQGLLVGDRHQGSLMNVSNKARVSYPGYNEMLSGVADPNLHSNARRYNPNVTVLEWLNQQPGLQGQVAAFGSWDMLPFILNVPRSQLPVNAGFSSASGELTPELQLLNKLQRQTPSPWASVRLDVFTHQFALEYLKRKKPRLLYVAYGETDDFAHDRQYDQYLWAAKRSDQFIAELWQQLQNDPFYRDQTTLLITTDHGRGRHADSWSHHGSVRAMAGYLQKLTASAAVEGSDEIWLAALGPAIVAQGIKNTGTTWWQHQVASTVAELLGYDFQRFQYKAQAALPVSGNSQQLAQRGNSLQATAP
ncbi:MAG TPA: phosphoglyceromutase [Rheinheimera sp.]|uniref:alkaline phosphatase family protein n=1 Tax=Rheinheimera sp. TaxID=1869214 RepID=UPI000EBAC5A0|nr:alkaline phosphatase family protein [Rheinheimera sp.]HCU65689.1 phosphoglyceromutase [Rheinheimera sp.]